MSRHYEMSVEITSFQPERTDAITAAAGEEWPFDDWNEYEGKLTASAEDSLCGGESEEEFAERLSLAIWKANTGFCEVTVRATYLEELPYEEHCLGEDDYTRLMTSANTPNDPHEQAKEEATY
jgi:hypothetical protein